MTATLARELVAAASAAGLLLAGAGVGPAEAAAQAAPPAIRIIAEAEDFKIERGDWSGAPYGDNYFASTFAISFLSRMAYLSAPASGGTAVATQRILVPRDGNYRAFARYEQPFAFSVEFTLEIEQQGRIVFRQTYGRLADAKIWAFAEPRRLPMQRFWWGGTDNVVWQEAGPVHLARGEARLRLIAGPQMDGDRPRAQAAKRNVDVIVLTDDAAGIERQRAATYLEMDGWLVQDGDLFVRFTNPLDGRGPVIPVVEPFEAGQHSPYYVHVRDWTSTRVLRSGRLVATPFVLAGPRTESVRPEVLAPVLDPTRFPTIPAGEYLEPGESSGWVPLGSVLDALHDSQWVPRAIDQANTAGDKGVDLELEFGVPDGEGGLRLVRRVRVDGVSDYLSPAAFEVPGNVRARPTIRTELEALRWLNGEVAKFPRRGKIPERLPVFGILGFSDARDDPGPIGEQARRLAAALGDSTTPKPGRRTAIVTHWNPAQVERGVADAEKSGRLSSIGIVSYGDEIQIGPASGTGSPALDADYRTWLRARGVADSPTARFTEDPADPWYYYSRLFALEKELDRYAKTTRWIESHVASEVRTGINYSPHANFMVDDLHFVRPFKLGALTLPWSEDYIWQIPEFSAQVMGYLVSGLRAGAKYHALPILMYVMPHSPGNTPRDFRLSFYAAIAHGAKLIHYFCATPLAVGMTENYIATDDLGMWRAVHDTTHDAGVFEDYVVDSRVRPARVGLLLSSVDEIQTGDSNRKGGIHNQERKAVYYALRHAQVPVDFVTEDDVIEGRATDMRVIYVTQQFLHSKAVAALSHWVEGGGTLVALVGGGFTDELGRDDPATHALFGVVEQEIWKDPALPMVLAKQDLPPYAPVDQASWAGVSAPVLVWKQSLAPSDGRVVGTYADGKPAVVEKAHGKGRTVLFGFFPGMAYLKSGLPLRPVDRSATNDGFNHFLPTAMDVGLRRVLVDAFLPAGFERPVETSEPLVEATLLETPSSGRIAVPLMNYTGKPLASLSVTLRGVLGVRSVRSVERGPLRYEAKDGALTITLPLDVADMLLIAE